MFIQKNDHTGNLNLALPYNLSPEVLPLPRSLFKGKKYIYIQEKHREKSLSAALAMILNSRSQRVCLEPSH